MSAATTEAGSVQAYAASAQARLRGEVTPATFVICVGNEAGDLDSIVSSLAMAHHTAARRGLLGRALGGHHAQPQHGSVLGEPAVQQRAVAG